MASLRAAFEEKACVGMAELEHAKDKIIMGAERKSGEPGVSILQPVHIC
jgi:ATP-dependent Zn protease